MMEEQKKLSYYLAYLTDETLIAFGDYYEFFKMYDRKNKNWVSSKISFSQMLHDFRFREISEEEAKKITGNHLPIELYQAHCDLLSNHKK